jgi:hypothetical protein
MVNGKEVNEVVGGPYGGVIEWSDDVNLFVGPMLDMDFQNELGGAAVLMELVAESFDTRRSDIHTFYLEPHEAADPSRVTNSSLGSYDVAKCKPAIQSSTIEGNMAKYAVSGDMTVLAHTDCEKSPWWMVDLFETREISSVVIKNRQDCCQERLEGVMVELLNYDDSLVASLQHDPAVNGPFGEEWTASFGNKSARKVRVSIVNPRGPCEFLNLASVQVFASECTFRDSCGEGPGCDYGDIALCKPTDQSSTMQPGAGVEDLGLNSLHAVDGTQLLSHTDCEASPWWELDLLSERTVTEVIIKNREDCCYNRLDGVLLELLNDSDQLTGRFQRAYGRGACNPLATIIFDHFSLFPFLPSRITFDHLPQTIQLEVRSSRC